MEASIQELIYSGGGDRGLTSYFALLRRAAPCANFTGHHQANRGDSAGIREGRVTLVTFLSFSVPWNPYRIL